VRSSQLLLALATVGCDPPCEPYWKLRCDSCGPESGACRHAKSAAVAELSEDGQCKKLVALAESESDFSKQRYCELHVATARSFEELRGPWRCATQSNGSAPGVTIDVRPPGPLDAKRGELVVDGRSTPIGGLAHATFHVDGGPACTYWLLPHETSEGAVGLALLCPEPAGGLPSGMIRCTK
jgi:hypothetical protein